MSSDKDWLNNIFICLPDVAERILDELIKNEDYEKRLKKFEYHRGLKLDIYCQCHEDDCWDCQEVLAEYHDLRKQELSLDNIFHLRLVCKDLKKIVDNYEKVWDGFDQNQPLLYPTILGQVENVERLLAKGVDVNKRGAKNRRFKGYREADFLPTLPLDLAVECGYLDVAKLLIEGGADMCSKDARYHRNARILPIHAAARNGHVPILELLISKGMDINVRGGYPPAGGMGRGYVATHKTALGYAAMCGQKEAVEWLIRNGANTNSCNPLHLAAINGHVPILKLLISKGMDINAQSPLNKTALEYATEHGHKEAVEWLISNGANANAVCLHLAARKGHVPILELLISQGMDINAQGGDRNKTALEHATEYGQKEAVEWLISNGANANADPLCWAASEGHVSILELLISQGMDINSRGGLLHKTALEYSKRYRQKEAEEWLISKGANLDCPDLGQTGPTGQSRG